MRIWTNAIIAGGLLAAAVIGKKLVRARRGARSVLAPAVTTEGSIAHEVVGPTDAMLEFETEIDGIVVNGVDIIRWNAAGQIVDFKVMLRPLKAINLIHQRMAAMLQSAA